jgi:hypothetical protein
MPEMNAETLNARLLGGHRLLVTRDPAGRPLRCEVEFFGEVVPLSLFDAYVAAGMIGVPKDGNGYTVTAEGKRRLARPPGRR